MKGKDYQKYPSESISADHAQLAREHTQLLKEHAQLLKEHTHLLKEQAQQSKKFQEEALACSLVADILTTEEFAKRIKSSRATVLVWKRDRVLIKGRHYNQKGKYVTFMWPLSYVRMMEDDLLPGQKSAQPEAKKTQATVKNIHKKTVRQTTTNCSRLGTDF